MYIFVTHVNRATDSNLALPDTATTRLLTHQLQLEVELAVFGSYVCGALELNY